MTIQEIRKNAARQAWKKFCLARNWARHCAERLPRGHVSVTASILINYLTTEGMPVPDVVRAALLADRRDWVGLQAFLARYKGT